MKKDRIVVVTGAAGGLGRAYALGFAAQGAHLILTDMNHGGLRETAALVEGAGGSAEIHVFDIADEPSIDGFARAVGESHDGVDLLINNAGIAYGPLTQIASLPDHGQKDWLRFLAVNTVAPILLAYALRPLLKARKGSIINQSSMAATDPVAAYGITKAALNAATRALAHSMADDGIRVNAIAPGLLATEASEAGMTPEQKAHVQQADMLKQAGKPQDAVGVALFLASEAAAYVNCEIIHVDGGSRIRQWRY